MDNKLVDHFQPEQAASLPIASVSAVARPVGYVELVRTNSNFRNLWFGQLISAAGDWFNNVALLGLALQLTGSGFAAGMVLLATSLPYFFLIPLAGPIVDRFSRKKVMIVSNLAGAALALVFLLVRDAGSLWLLYLGCALLIATAAFFNPAATAIVPNLVSEGELYPANTLSGSTWGIMVMVGSGLGGIVSASFGREVVFILNSLSFLVSTVLIWRIQTPGRPVEPTSGTALSTWGDFLAGLSYLRSHGPVMALAACKAGWGLGGGVLVLLTVFGQQTFRAGDGGIGLLYAGRGLGALLGPILIRPLVESNTGRMRWAIALAYLVQAAGYTVFALSSGVGVWLATLALVVGHSGGGVAWAGSSILLQQIVPDEFRGRVFATDLGLSTLTNSLSTLAFSLALEGQVSPISLAGVGAVIFFGYGLAWAYLTSRPPFRL